MTTLNIKIVGTEGDSVMVKYASENSAKAIDEYDAVAYQPKMMGYTTVEEFIEGIKSNLLAVVKVRDAAEQSVLDLTEWEGHESSHDIEETPEAQAIEIPDPLPTQLINVNPEVIL